MKQHTMDEGRLGHVKKSQNYNRKCVHVMNDIIRNQQVSWVCYLHLYDEKLLILPYLTLPHSFYKIRPNSRTNASTRIAETEQNAYSVTFEIGPNKL